MEKNLLMVKPGENVHLPDTRRNTCDTLRRWGEEEEDSVISDSQGSMEKPNGNIRNSNDKITTLPPPHAHTPLTR